MSLFIVANSPRPATARDATAWPRVLTAEATALSVDPAQASNADTAPSNAFSPFAAGSVTECTSTPAACLVIAAAAGGSIDNLDASVILTRSRTLQDVWGYRNAMLLPEFHSFSRVMDSSGGCPRPYRFGGIGHLFPN